MDEIVNVGPPKCSRVFMQLWQAMTVADPEMPETDFLLYAETWRRIREMEEAQAHAELKEKLQDLVAGPIMPMYEVPLPKLAALEKAAGKLNKEADAGGGESS